jgi:phosphate-selective porin OprO/OprP
MKSPRSLRAATTAAALSALALAPLAGRAQTAPSDDIAALREQIRQLDQKLRVLERNSELKDEATTAAAQKAVKVSADAKGFGLASADKSFELKFKLMAQFDSRVFLDYDGAANRDGFFLRRIRLPFTGSISNIDFNVTPELGANALSATSTTVGLIDAWVNVKLIPEFNIKAGRSPSPVGLEPGANRHFIESPFVNTLLPNRDLGIEANGSIDGGLVDYRVGAYIGTRNNTQSFSTDDADGDKTAAGRLTVAPFFAVKESPLSKLSFGIGASHGNERGSITASTTVTGIQNYVSNGQQTLLTIPSAFVQSTTKGNKASGTSIIADGDHTRISPSLEWYTGTPFSLVAEYAIEKQDYLYRKQSAGTGISNAGIVGAVNTRRFDGETTAWRVSAGYVLTGEEATKNGVNPLSPFKWGADSWGAFEVVGRLSGVDYADSLYDTALGGLSPTANATGAFAYGAGLNWYFNNNFRVLFNVEKTELEGGGAGTSGALSDELYFFTRLQLSF